MEEKPRSKNPTNRECSSVKQVLLDMKSAGFSSDAINKLLYECEINPVMREEADKKYSQHQYPQSAIVFAKVSNKIEFSRILSPKAVAVLNLMSCAMHVNNLIQVTLDELMNYTSLGNKNTVKKALIELQKNGFIAVRLKGNTRRGTVYMVNPLVARCGKEIPGMKRTFWALTGTKYNGKKITEYSKPHETWKENVKKKTYSIGYESIKISEKEKIRFSKFNKPAKDIKKDLPKATDEPEDALPF